MLRTCILLCFGFFSFAVNADNPVPVNIFGSDPVNAVRTVSVKTGYIPANAVKSVPVNTDRYISSNVVRSVPVNEDRYISSNVIKSVPVNEDRYIPVSAAKAVPVSAAKTVPVNTVKSVSANADSSVWLLVDTKAHKIEIKKGEQTIETMQGIAIGRKGAGLKTHRGDDITPYGNYRIGWVGERSNFHKFFGLTYPSVQDAEIALKKGVISERNYNDIVVAHRLNLVPPQDTPLGGKIGIHGLGAGDEKVHEIFDWTHGCIALTNTQIDHLSQWLDTGTVVKIR